MAFDLLNDAGAAVDPAPSGFVALSGLDSGDFLILSAPFALTGVISGCKVKARAAGANMTLDLDTGQFMVQGQSAGLDAIANSSTALVIGGSHASLHRLDLVVAAPTRALMAVRVATTTSGTMNSSFANNSVVDGVTLITGDRILIKDQGNSDNGIYTVNSSGAPTRATDADATGELLTGDSVPVIAGTTNKGLKFWLTNVGTITIGTTTMTWRQHTESGAVWVLPGTAAASPAYPALPVDADGNLTVCVLAAVFIGNNDTAIVNPTASPGANDGMIADRRILISQWLSPMLGSGSGRYFTGVS
jgi:hypothetical protein